MQVLAVEAADRILFLRADRLRRIVRRSAAQSAQNPAGQSAEWLDIDGLLYERLAIEDVFGTARDEDPSAHLILYEDDDARVAFVVRKALDFFQSDAPLSAPAAEWSAAVARGVVVGYLPLGELRRHLVSSADRAIRTATAMLQILGPIRVADGVLYAGTTLLQSNFAFVDEVGTRTDHGCTIFQGDVRVATTVIRSGGHERAIGTRAGEDIVERVLHRGRSFRGVARTLGRDWAIAYEPVRAEDGRVAGMIATFQEISARVVPVLCPRAAAAFLRGERDDALH